MTSHIRRRALLLYVTDNKLLRIIQTVMCHRTDAHSWLDLNMFFSCEIFMWTSAGLMKFETKNADKIKQ